MQRLKDKGHQSKLAWRFEDLYRNRVLTDVILFTSDGMELKAHWLILAAYSEIFKQLAISRKTMKNDCVGTVVRLEFTSDIVAILLNYCYKGELIITVSTKPQVQKAAQLLLMNDILKLLETNELDAQGEPINNPKDLESASVSLDCPGPSGETTLSLQQDQNLLEAGNAEIDNVDLRKSSKTTGIWPESLKSTSSLLKQFSEIVTLQSESGRLKPKSVSPDSSDKFEKEKFSKYISLDLSNLENSKLRRELMKKQNPLLKKRPTIPTRRSVYHKVIVPKNRQSKDTWNPTLAVKTAQRTAEKLFHTQILLHCCVTLDSLDTNDKLFLCRKCNKKFTRYSVWRLHYSSAHLKELFKGVSQQDLRRTFRKRKHRTSLQKEEAQIFYWGDLNSLAGQEDESASNGGYPNREYDIDNNIHVTFQSHVSDGSGPPAILPAQQLPAAVVSVVNTTPLHTEPVVAAPQEAPLIQNPVYLAPQQPYNNAPVPQTQFTTSTIIQPNQTQTSLPQAPLHHPMQQAPISQTPVNQTQLIDQSNLHVQVSITQPDLSQAPALSQTPTLPGTSTLPPVQQVADASLSATPVQGPPIAQNPSISLSPSIVPNQTLAQNTASKPQDSTSSQWLPSHDSWMSFLQSDSFTASVLGPPPPQQQNTQYITMVKCSVKGCSFAGYSTRAVNKHMHDTHLNMECTYCMFACSDKEELEKHIAERHERRKARQYSCSACGKKFSKAIHHRTHEQSHHGINHNMKEYRCELEGCEFSTLAKHNYFKHKMTHEEKMYSCQYCGIKIRTMDYLQRHINKQHLNIRPFQCEHCGSAFGDMHALKSHISAVHVKKKEFKCEHCSYAANIRYKVATHMYQVHGIRASFDKRKEIKCPHCSYTALVKSWMTKHMDRHATSKNYTCELCGKTFGSPRNLNSHTRWAHKTAKHQCPHCEYITKTPTRLKNHVKTQHMFRGYKPYTCPYCTFKCATGGNCRKHVMQKHPGQQVSYNRNEELIAYMKAAGRQDEEEPFTQIVS